MLIDSCCKELIQGGFRFSIINFFVKLLLSVNSPDFLSESQKLIGTKWDYERHFILNI